jgi:hypothetical protein
MDAGGELVYSGYIFASEYSDKLSARLKFEEATPLSKTLGILKRTLKYNLIDFPLCDFFFITHHEYFGHGSVDRVVSHNYLGEPKWDFNIRFALTPSPLPFTGPFDIGGSYRCYRRIKNIDENLYFQIGGSNGTLLLSDIIFEKIFTSKKIDYYTSLLYFKSRLDIFGYVISTRDEKEEDFPGFHDFEIYLYKINKKYGYTDVSEYKLTSSEMKRKVYLSLIDPMLLYSIYNFYHYLFTGNKETKIALIKIKEFALLPTIKTDATPWGLENYLDLYFRYNELVGKLYTRKGDETFEDFWGVGISLNGFKLFDEKLILGCSVDYWKQPKVKNGFNTAINSTVLLDSLAVKLKMGYKTTGYLLGEDLAEGFYGNIGVSFGR